MEDKKKLVNALKRNVRLKENRIVYSAIIVKNLSLLKLREELIKIGTILEEDQEQQIYVVKIPVGFINRIMTYVALQLKGDEILLCASAIEGLIDMHSAEKVIKKLRTVYERDFHFHEREN